MTRNILFIHGAGEGAWAADAKLAQSLRAALGPGYAVHNPQMPDEEEPDYRSWAETIADEIGRLGPGAMLVGHSIGGSVIAKALSEGLGDARLSGLFLVATPFWHDDKVWHWPEAELPPDAAKRFPRGVPVFLYHSTADEVVPVAHLDMLAKTLPQARVRRLGGRNHQLDDDLSEVAEDIRGLG